MEQVRDVVYAEKMAEIAESIYSQLNLRIDKVGPQIIGTLYCNFYGIY